MTKSWTPRAALMAATSLLIAFGGALVGGAPNIAQAEPSPQSKIATTPTNKLILHASELKTYVVYEWTTGGVQHNAWPGDGQTPPADAARLQLTLYNFPTGQIRRIAFSDHASTPWHRNKGQDVLFYYLSSQQVEFVDGRAVYSHVGDASMHPEGVMHHSETLVPGERLEYGFAPQGRSGHDLLSFSGRDMTEHQITETVAGGRRTETVDGEAQGGATYHAKLFQFPGYLMAEDSFPKGEGVGVHLNASEKLLYVVSGRLKVTSGDATGEVGPGDVVRMAAGRPFARQALEDTVAVEIDGSEAPPDL